MGANCKQMFGQRIHRLDDLGLGTAHVGNDRARFAEGRQLGNLFDQQLHWRAQDHHIGIAHTLGEIGGCDINYATIQRLVACFLTPRDADDTAGVARCTERQRKRCPHQANAED